MIVMRRDLMLAAVVVVMGCGGDAATNGGGETDAGDTDATVGTDGGGGGDSTVSNDSGSPGDGGGTDTGGGGSDAGPSVDGGKASDPGQVSCGAASCPTATEYCCVRFLFDGGTGDASCINDDAGGGACNGIRERCNESADCDAGRICCAQFGGGSGGTACRTPGANPGDPCWIGGVQLCRTANECGDAGACNVLTCGTRQLEVCGKPQGCQ